VIINENIKRIDVKDEAYDDAIVNGRPHAVTLNDCDNKIDGSRKMAGY
jgi:hypothetical protein